MTRSLVLLLIGGVAMAAAQSPFPAPANALPDHPFFIKKTWFIGGKGNWDGLALDSAASRLYIAHGREVQVVDVESGVLAASIGGFREAHSIALNTDNQVGYISDGPAMLAKVLNLRTLEVESEIRLDSSPRKLMIEPTTNTLVVVSTSPATAPPPTAPRDELRAAALDQWHEAEKAAAVASKVSRFHMLPHVPCSDSTGGPDHVPSWGSRLTLIDLDSNSPVAEVELCGYVGPAVAGGDGAVYAGLVTGSRILRMDVSAIRDLAKVGGQHLSKGSAREMQPTVRNGALHIYWPTSSLSPGRPVPLPHSDYEGLATFPSCGQPRALAMDVKDNRLFNACGDQSMAVFEGGTGKRIASKWIGLGADAVDYDPERDLIFVANGGGDGSVTIIRSDRNDVYETLQTLPTHPGARTLAANSSTGQIYLLSIFQVADLANPPRNGIGTLKIAPQDASFQVLVVGN